MMARWLMVVAMVGAGIVGRAETHAPLFPLLDGRVLCGYQGWFRTPGDASGVGWRHYVRRQGDQWLPETEYLPDVSDAAPEARATLPLEFEGGRKVEVVTSDHRDTVDRHFRWMRQHNIDGVFVQRFPVDMYHRGRTEPKPFRDSGDRVLMYCRDAAAAHGRSHALMYDLSGLCALAAEVVETDWRHLLKSGVVNPKADRFWQRHLGRPIVAIWGVGFNDGRAYGLDACERLVDFFKAQGFAVLVGVPFYWRTLRNDAVSDPRLLEIIGKADIVHSWSVGRFRDDAGVKHAEAIWREDQAWCRERGLAFMPVVFPGFGWRNLKGRDDGIPRRGGLFLWSQFGAAQRAGSISVYVAMFDEVDEGTQIFKVDMNPPAGKGFSFRTYEGVPQDHYLWLTGEATRHFRGGQPFPEALPPR